MKKLRVVKEKTSITFTDVLKFIAITIAILVLVDNFHPFLKTFSVGNTNSPISVEKVK